HHWWWSVRALGPAEPFRRGAQTAPDRREGGICGCGALKSLQRGKGIRPGARKPRDMRHLPRFALVPLAALVSLAPFAVDAAVTRAGADTAADCASAFSAAPAAQLDYTTVPAARLAQIGQTVQLSGRWDPSAWDGLTSAVACVELNGAFDDALGTVVAAPPASGAFDHSFVVPADVPDASTICARIRLAGDPAGPATEAVWVSKTHCFEIDTSGDDVAPPGDTTPTTSPAPTSTTTTSPATMSATTPPVQPAIVPGPGAETPPVSPTTPAGGARGLRSGGRRCGPRDTGRGGRRPARDPIPGADAGGGDLLSGSRPDSGAARHGVHLGPVAARRRAVAVHRSGAAGALRPAAPPAFAGLTRSRFRPRARRWGRTRGRNRTDRRFRRCPRARPVVLKVPTGPRSRPVVPGHQPPPRSTPGGRRPGSASDQPGDERLVVGNALARGDGVVEGPAEFPDPGVVVGLLAPVRRRLGRLEDAFGALGHHRLRRFHHRDR